MSILLENMGFGEFKYMGMSIERDNLVFLGKKGIKKNNGFYESGHLGEVELGMNLKKDSIFKVCCSRRLSVRSEGWVDNSMSFIKKREIIMEDRVLESD